MIGTLYLNADNMLILLVFVDLFIRLLKAEILFNYLEMYNKATDFGTKKHLIFAAENTNLRRRTII